MTNWIIERKQTSLSINVKSNSNIRLSLDIFISSDATKPHVVQSLVATTDYPSFSPLWQQFL